MKRKHSSFVCVSKIVGRFTDKVFVCLLTKSISLQKPLLVRCVWVRESFHSQLALDSDYSLFFCGASFYTKPNKTSFFIFSSNRTEKRDERVSSSH